MSRHRPDENAVRDQMREHSARTEPPARTGAGVAEEPDAAQHPPRTDPSQDDPSPAGDQEPPTDGDRVSDGGANGDAASPAGEQREVQGASEADDSATDDSPVDESSPVASERDEYLALAKRTQADFENYRKRAAKDMAAAGTRARVGLIREILPVVDNLERALASAANGDEGLVQGVRLVYSDLQGVLARTGVEAIEPAGVLFDPNIHEALTTRQQDGAETGVVLDVVEKGYRVGETVIRPARVVVAA